MKLLAAKVWLTGGVGKWAGGGWCVFLHGTEEQAPVEEEVHPNYMQMQIHNTAWHCGAASSIVLPVH